MWELCSKFLSLFYSEFLLKSLHNAQFYSFYATDSIIILHLSKSLSTLFNYIAGSVASYLQMYFQNTANNDELPVYYNIASYILSFNRQVRQPQMGHTYTLYHLVPHWHIPQLH